ncbi:DgyrCDS2783 [Dimorphilus gyrociliatus]|uniref:DgyrCDS2783 n=1 Tax=Dimorphilus gyrociliatus TaxID=2664684 RepID=A0A7I8VD79_9ANNE|nr:DgyrCDS2783 [Dimorphilus gyrociliatus]
MPSSEDFKLEILVNKQPIHEYVDNKTGKVFVESNLYSPISYLQKITEKIEGQTVTQNVPVTPYEIRLTTSNKARGQYFRIMVDGMKIKGMSITPGKEKYVTGFRDGNKVRELLFSLPNMSEHKDRMTNVNRSEIGTISVECWKGVLRARIEDKRNPLKFTQATKKDAYLVTKGQSLLPTSCAGKTIEKKKDTRSVDKWSLEKKMSTLTVHYRMANELSAIGFTVAGGNINAPDVKEKRISDPERKRPLTAVIDLTGDDIIEEKVRKIDVINIENEKNQTRPNRNKKNGVNNTVINSQTMVKIENSEKRDCSDKLKSVPTEKATQNEDIAEDSEEEVSTLIENNSKSESENNSSLSNHEEDMDTEEESNEDEEQAEENDKEETLAKSNDGGEQTDVNKKDKQSEANEEQQSKAEVNQKSEVKEDPQNETREDQQDETKEEDQLDETEGDQQSEENNEEKQIAISDKEEKTEELENIEESNTTKEDDPSSQSLQNEETANGEKEKEKCTGDKEKNSVGNIDNKHTMENIDKEADGNQSNSESFDTQKQESQNESFANVDTSQNVHSVSQFKAINEDSDSEDNYVLSEPDEDGDLMSTSSTVMG